MFYSAEKNGFYSREIHGENMPADVVEITTEEHTALLEGQSQGKLITADGDGRPALTDPPPPTTDQLVAQYMTHLESFYDSKARERRYDNRLTCSLRAGYPGPFQAEGLAFAIWMDQCNAYAYGVMADVLYGDRPMPAVSALIAELPLLAWPA